MAENMDFSMEVYKHYGLDLLKMKGNKEEHDWGICKKEDARKITGNMAGFGMDHSQRIIIDYDRDYGWTLVRRYEKEGSTKVDTKIENWVSVNLPENCPNVCISFKREIADMQIKKFGARPIYGFDSETEDWLPVKIFITYGGALAPDQKDLETNTVLSGTI